MLTFTTRAAGIPCQVEVLDYSRVPDEGTQFEYRLLDHRGREARWLEKRLNAKQRARLEEECMDMVMADALDIYHQFG